MVNPLLINLYKILNNNYQDINQNKNKKDYK